MKKTSDKDFIKRGSELESLLHSEHTVRIEKLIVSGDGLARLNFENKSLVVFIPATAPDEKVKVRIVRIEKNHLIGEILQILEPSPYRRPAPCKYAENCGGCVWQHIEETEQHRQKELILKDLLKKFIPDVSYTMSPLVASEKNLYYRNRIQLKQSGKQLGYFKKGTHQIVDIENCLLAEKEIGSQISNIKSNLKPAVELKKFELRINQLNQFEYYPIGTDGEGLSFSQVNNLVNTKLLNQVTSLVKTISPTFLSELYSGAGNFTFPLLASLPGLRIESVELNSKLTAFATKKLTDLKLQKRLFAFTADCESFVQRRELSREFVLLDPPRAGCSDVVLNQLTSSKPQNILYISCHPAYLARDLKKIISAVPDYKIQHLQIFDMFPQTDHFETLILLTQNLTK